MEDRVSLYPGRVTLTPVSGQENTYDMVRADQPTQDGTPLNKASLLKDTTAALYGLGTDAVPDEVLEKLSKSVLTKVNEKYTKVTKALSEYAIGDTVSLNVDGVPTDFLVVHHGLPSELYDESCDGTWLLMKGVYGNREWNSSLNNSYGDSTVHTYLNGDFLGLFDDGVQGQIKTVKIPYVNGTGLYGSIASGSSGLSTQIFLLSGYEVGFTTSDGNFPVDGGKLDYFESGDASGSAARTKRIVDSIYWWLRSPIAASATESSQVTTVGSCIGIECTSKSGSYGYIRPAFIMPSDTVFTWYEDADGNHYTSREVETQLTDVFGDLVSIPASQIKGGVKIQTGSYTGTGTYGADNPCSLTFDFVPEALLIFMRHAYSSMMIMTRDWDNYVIIGGSNSFGTQSSQFAGETVSWWFTGSETYSTAQFNQSGKAYGYIAIG